MEEKGKAPEERQLMKIDDMSLEEIQLQEQLYNSAGLNPVVDAGLKDYDDRLQRENKLLNKVLGPRGSDIRGYGEAVARRVAFAIYNLLNKQYGGKVGDLRSYIMALQEERDQTNTKYDELLGRVVGILGDEYKELRTDSREFMKKLTTTLGEDLKESKIDHQALAERLADIDGLRSQIKTLEKEKAQLKERHESQITALTNQYSTEMEKLSSQIAELESTIKALESEIATLTNDLARARGDYKQLKTAITTLAGGITYEEIGNKLGEELYAFLLKDSKVPHMVIDGVGKFIDFKKYLGLAAVKGAEAATRQAEKSLRSALSK